MSILKAYFDKSVNQASPVQPDFDRVVNYDEDGNEIITYVEVDYPKILESHGVVGDWSLDALLKAGINPNFPIHTSNPTRLDGVGTVQDAEAFFNSLILEDAPEDNENN